MIRSRKSKHSSNRNFYFSVFLILVSCCPERDFLCASGKCVPVDDVCDFKDDCDDGSDEEFCGTSIWNLPPASLHTLQLQRAIFLFSLFNSSFFSFKMPDRGCGNQLFLPLIKKNTILSNNQTLSIPLVLVLVFLQRVSDCLLRHIHQGTLQQSVFQFKKNKRFYWTSSGSPSLCPPVIFCFVPNEYDPGVPSQGRVILSATPVDGTTAVWECTAGVWRWLTSA